MHIKKEGPVDVVASHLSKVCLIPAGTPNMSERTAWSQLVKDNIPGSWDCVCAAVKCTLCKNRFDSPHMWRLCDLIEARRERQPHHQHL